VITAGGTREPIDAVRVIANRSSGKQGYALAEDAFRRGARVTVISTVDLPVVSGVSVVSVETAQQMHDAVTAEAESADVVIMAAAVADFRPVLSVEGKIKKHQGVPTITLEPTPDILAQLGSCKPAHQVLVGFAAETENLVDNARGKLERKNLDLIVANDVSAPGVGFAHDTNAVTILSASGEMKSVALANKRTIATAVLDSVVKVQSARRLPS
jgi:phosphopantothenoylcysteine decarboxylase/phosphopantothenate--cysteine ligase